MTQPHPATPTTAATHPDPYPFYADLVANRPFGYDTGSGLWVAAGASAVSEVLADPACRVGRVPSRCRAASSAPRPARCSASWSG